MGRQSFTLLGVEIGTGSGWDYADHSVWWIYDFEPVSGLPLQKCDSLNIDILNGLFEARAADGSIESSTSITETIHNAAPHNPIKVYATVGVDGLTKGRTENIFPDTISLRQLLASFGEYTSIALVITKP